MHNQRMGSSIRFSLVLAISICLNLLVPDMGCSVAVAQRPRGRTTAINSEVALMAPSREVQVLLEEAERGIKNEQWSEATFALGILLGLEDSRKDDFSGVDFFAERDELAELVPKPGETSDLYTLKKTVFQRAFELIEALPADATKMIDLRYGLQARQKLDQAISGADWGTVAEVASKYGFTTAGQDATLILAEQCLHRGDALSASRLFDRLVRQKSAFERLGPALGVLAAASSQSIGKHAEALSLIESTRKTFNTLDLNWKDTKISWDNRSVFSKDFLDKMDVTGQHVIRRVVMQPYYPSGNANRNADTNGGIPLPILRWHTELHESKQHKDNLELTLKSKLSDGKSTLIPSRTPISVGPWIIASTYDQRIVAIDTLTGRLGWECFYSGMPLGFSMDGYLNRDSHSFNLPSPDYLTKRVWGETLLGAISSDGERIYNISELPALDVAESFALGQNARVSKSQSFRNYNVMQCWSVREEGKIKWEVGGQKSEVEPKLAGMLFLGSPLPHENELLVLGELNGDLSLLALDPESGKQYWRQPLTTNYGTIAGDLMRRSSGALPAADGAVIVCPTLSGYLIAYNKSDRSLLWAFKYPVKPSLVAANQVGVFGQVERADFSPLTPRSVDTSVVINNGIVVFAPLDGNDAYGIKISDGSLLWKLSDSNIDQVRYVAGAWKDIAVIVCHSAIVAVDQKTGASKWPPIAFPDGQQVIGRGVRKEGVYLVPTSGQNILQIDLVSGKIADSIRVEQPLGNIISVGDRLICATPFELDCYTVREAFQIQLKEELQRNSRSPTGLAQQGELALGNGDFDGALTYLEQAHQLDPKNAEINLLVNKVGIAALTADFDKYQARVNLFDSLFIDRDKIPYLRLMITGLQKQGRTKETLATLFKLSRLRTSQRQEQMSGSANMELNSTWSVQEDRWIATQLRNSISNLTPAELAETKVVVDEEVALLEKLPSHVRRVKLGHFEGFQQTEPLRQESAMKLVLQKDYLQAERLLTSDDLLDSSDLSSKEIAKRKEILASIYARTKRVELASRYLAGDLSRLEAILSDVATSTNSGLLLPSDRAVRNARTVKPISDWPTGKVQVITRPIDIPSLDKSMAEASACKWKTRIGDSLAGWQVHAASANLVFTNPSSGEQFQVYVDIGIQGNSSVPVVHSVDSIVLLEINGQIIAIDTLRGSTREMEGVLWRESFVNGFPDSRPRILTDAKVWGLPSMKGNFRVAAVTRSGIICLLDDELSCLDLTTGGKLWTRTGFKGCSFASINGKLNVHDPNNRIRFSLDIRDGAILERKPLEIDGMSTVSSIGRYWLMDVSGKKEAKQSLLRLVDSSDGRIVFSTELPANTRIAIDGESGVIVLKPTGELTYWNLAEEKEFIRKIEGDLKFSQISVQRFGDTMLTMLYSNAMFLSDFKLGPDEADLNFVPVSGRLIALSAKDASNVWEQNPLVTQFYFPLSQSRNSPLVTFVRMLKLNKIQNRAVDFMSVAVVDIRNGRVVYSGDDFPAIRGLGFNQEIMEDQDKIAIEYLGTRVELKLTADPWSEEPIYDFGSLELSEFKKRIDAKAKELKSSAPPASKLDLPLK